MRDERDERGLPPRLLPPGFETPLRIPRDTRELTRDWRGSAETSPSAGTSSIPFQPLITLLGSSASEDFIQASDMWLRGYMHNTYHVKVVVNSISNCTLVLESAPTVEGPWDTVTSYTQATQTMAVISSEGGTNKFSGLVRWRIEKDASDWSTCFQLKALPGRSISDVVDTPRRVR